MSPFQIKQYRVKKNQLVAQFILTIFRQTLQVSGVSRPITRRYNRMYTTVGTHCSFQMTVCCLGWIGTNPTKTTDSHLKRISANCCIHTVVHLDDGPRYARNMQKLTKYTKNKFASSRFSLHDHIEMQVNKTQNIIKICMHHNSQ